MSRFLDDPDLYWRVWDKIEPLDDKRVLVTRALDIEDELTFKKPSIHTHGNLPVRRGLSSPSIVR
jgi:hypothetical protein